MGDPIITQLVKDLHDPKQQINVICMGIRSSGKSTKALGLARYCVDNDLFDEYFLFLPAANREIAGSYNWLSQYRKVHIFTEWTPLFYLLDRPAAEVQKGKGSLIFLDDLGSTGMNASDPYWHRVVSQQRHERVSVIMNFHLLASQRIISPFCCQNCSYFFMLTPYGLLQSSPMSRCCVVHSYNIWTIVHSIQAS